MIRRKSATPKFLASNRSERIVGFATRLRRVIQDEDGSNSLVYHTTSGTP